MVLQAQENRAMILAAGLGARLKPLTDHKPKALLEWEGKPLLERVILKLKSEGFTSIIINVHHFAAMIMDFVKHRDQFGIEKRFTKFEDLLSIDEIDAIHVVSPIADHAWMSLASLKAGKHTACTVPMATTTADCVALCEARKASGKVYMMMETELLEMLA